jgi:ribosomal protein S27AE
MLNRPDAFPQKMDHEKSFAALNTTCPKCGRIIEPQEIRRVNCREGSALPLVAANGSIQQKRRLEYARANLVVYDDVHCLL